MSPTPSALAAASHSAFVVIAAAHLPDVSSAGPYCPAGQTQSAHVSVTAAALALKRPAAHGVHDEAAVAFCHLPAGQAAHEPAPGSAANRPAAQSAHVALPAVL